MQASCIGQSIFLFAILSAGISIGCTTTDGSDGSGEGGGSCEKPSPYNVRPDDLTDHALPVYPMECPPYTTIITGQIGGVPYDLMAPSEFKLSTFEGGFVELLFPSDVPNDDFVYLTSEEAFDPGTLVPILGMVRLPNTTHRYQVRYESRLVMRSKYTHVDFHLLVTDGPDDGYLQGCANRSSMVE